MYARRPIARKQDLYIKDAREDCRVNTLLSATAISVTTASGDSPKRGVADPKVPNLRDDDGRPRR